MDALLATMSEWSELSLPDVGDLGKPDATQAYAGTPLDQCLVEAAGPAGAGAMQHQNFGLYQQHVDHHHQQHQQLHHHHHQHNQHNHVVPSMSPVPMQQQQQQQPRHSLDALHEVPVAFLERPMSWPTAFQQQAAAYGIHTQHGGHAALAAPPRGHRGSCDMPPQPQMHVQARRSASFSMGDAPSTSPWWTEEMLDMSSTDLNALIAANPHRICPELVDQLKLARRRKKNRMYAKRSRQRRQSGDAHGATAAKSARMQCKIDALMAANDTLRDTMQGEATLG